MPSLPKGKEARNHVEIGAVTLENFAITQDQHKIDNLTTYNFSKKLTKKEQGLFCESVLPLGFNTKQLQDTTLQEVGQCMDSKHAQKVLTKTAIADLEKHEKKAPTGDPANKKVKNAKRFYNNKILKTIPSSAEFITVKITGLSAMRDNPDLEASAPASEQTKAALWAEPTSPNASSTADSSSLLKPGHNK